jgi:REP element-mobilizing transposase RayT
MKFPERKRNRKLGYDYSLSGYYHVVTNVKGDRSIFGEVEEGEMILNNYGKIVEKCWLWLKRYRSIRLDEFIIMPDHFHGIIEIIPDDGADKIEGTAQELSVLNSSNQKRKSLSEIVGAFKMQSSKNIHIAGLKSFKWHRSFLVVSLSNYGIVLLVQMSN